MAVFAHSSLLTHHFWGDDYLHLYQIANVGFWEFIITPHGGHLYLLRNFFFFTFFKLFGLNATYFFAGVLLTHLVNIVFVYFIIRNLTSQTILAVLFAGLWGICPINQGTMGYYSVYGQVLASTCICWVLFDITCIDKMSTVVSNKRVIKWILLSIGASASFGVGLSMAAFLGLVVWFMLYGNQQRNSISIKLLSLLVIIPIIYVGFNWLYKWQTEIPASTISIPPNIFSTIPEAFQMLVSTIGYGVLSLLAFPFIIINRFGELTGIFPLASTKEVYHLSIALIFIIVGCFAVRLKIIPKKQLNQLLGIALLILLSYGMIAAGRAWFFTMFRVPVFKVFFTPRYHYAGTMLISVFLGLMISGWKIRSLTGRRILQLCLFIWLAGATVQSRHLSSHVVFSLKGSNESREYSEVIGEIRRVINTHKKGEEVHIPNRKAKHINVALQKANAMYTSWASLFMITFPDNVVNGRRIYFIDNKKQLVADKKIRKDTRIYNLLSDKMQ